MFDFIENEYVCKVCNSYMERVADELVCPSCGYIGVAED